MPRLVLLTVLLMPQPVLLAQDLQAVDESNWPRFRADTRLLLDRLKDMSGVLPESASREVRRLTEEEKPANPRQAILSVQKILDSHCLLGVTINPESRVKAARGGLRQVLRLDETHHVLLRVHNEGGVTHALRVSSDQAYQAGTKDPERWLEMAVVNEAPFANRLSGRPVEYRVLKLRARQSGKREAVFSFDVGQGSQDLGFRSDLPILFTIRPR